MRLHPNSTTDIPPPQRSSAAPAADRRSHSTARRRWLGIGAAVLLLLLLVLTPPLVNANRYRIKIADSMSASLGRPVHLDDVSFHLLPVPGFTLRNLVVSEDPDFGSEPTIRANSVEATLRVSSLWHRPVEFSTVRFVEPSVNLVRNAEGRWNLSEVLMHASRVDSAPTAQRHAGPAPRFPYIEATNGRVNVKLGATKLPFSLTEADFALWLPSAQQWRVRLVGHPARTDTNITDPGTVRLEGELRRADLPQNVPVSFTASWHNAPLGEASRILTGDDRGWRGSLNLDATLAGQLGNAHMAGKLTLGGLRRAEFFPTHPLDLQITCGSGFQLYPAGLKAFQCTLPDDARQPLSLRADQVDLFRPATAVATVQGTEIPVRWGLLWAALFSARVPTDLQPGGSFNIDLRHGPVESAPPAADAARSRARRRPVAVALPPDGAPVWSGGIDLVLPPTADTSTAGPAPDADSASPTNRLRFHVLPSVQPGAWPLFALDPTPVRLGPNALVSLSGTLAETGYSFSVNGSAPAAALLYPARYLPQLGDGLEQVLPFPPTSADPAHVTFTCSRSWSTAQTCKGPQTAAGPRPVVVPLSVTPARTPAQLAPSTLSPLERSPFNTPRPLAPTGTLPR